MFGKPALEYQEVTHHKDSKTCDKMMGDHKLFISAEVVCKRQYWHFDSMSSDTSDSENLADLKIIPDCA